MQLEEQKAIEINGYFLYKEYKKVDPLKFQSTIAYCTILNALWP